MELLKMKRMFLNERMERLTVETQLTELMKFCTLAELTKVEKEIKDKEESENGKPESN